jgi:hypothetical protein
MNKREANEKRNKRSNKPMKIEKELGKRECVRRKV